MAVQDTIHIATKIKTRILNVNSELKMGTYFVKVSHIERIMTEYTKDRHLLCTSDLRCRYLLKFLRQTLYLTFFSYGQNELRLHRQAVVKKSYKHTPY